MRAVEHWWNSTWGRLARKDVWLLTDGERWAVKVRIGSADEDRSVVLPFDCEEDARAELELLVDEREGRWRQI